MAALEWKRVLCPVDFSESSEAALEVAVELCRRFDSELLLLHAYRVPTAAVPGPSAEPDRQALAEVVEEVERLLGLWRDRASSLGVRRVSVHHVPGRPAPEILRFAREQRVDLVVMGAHGRTAMKHVLLGSVAERVVRRADCPVLTIRPRELGVSEPDYALLEG